MAVKYHHLQSPGALFDLTLSDRSHDSAERQPAWNCKKKKNVFSLHTEAPLAQTDWEWQHMVRPKKCQAWEKQNKKNVAHGSNSPTLWEGKTWYGTDIFSWQMYLFAMSSSHSRKLRQSVSTPVWKYQKKLRRGKGKAERDRRTGTDRDDQHLAISPSNLSLWTGIKTQDRVQRSGLELSDIWKAVITNVLPVITANPAHNPRQAAYELLTSYTVHYDSRVNAWDR